MIGTQMVVAEATTQKHPTRPASLLRRRGV